MTEIMFNENGNNSLVCNDSIEEKDISPEDMPFSEFDRCDCCGRHVSKLKPTDEADDPLFKDAKGKLLVKKIGKYPQCMERSEESKLAIKEAQLKYKNEGFEHPVDWLINKYGKKKTETLIYPKVVTYEHQSWECRDCKKLDVKKYLNKRKR